MSLTNLFVMYCSQTFCNLIIVKFKNALIIINNVGRKIQICHVPITKEYLDASTQFAPSLGVMALKTFVEQNSDEKVEFIDGTFSEIDDLVTRIRKDRPQIYGTSSQLVSHENSLRLLKEAKRLGAITIMGGHNPTQLSQEIVTNNPFVDFVVCGDGEEALLEIVRDSDPREIPNLTYRDDSGNVITNPRINLSLDSLPIVRYDSISLTPYLKQVAETTFDERIPITNYQRVYSHKGCGNRENTPGCVFCGRADIGVRFKSPKRYLEELVYLQEQIGADYVFDVGDDLLYDPKWLQELVELKELEGKLNLHIGCFGRSNRIDAKNAELLRRLGVVEVVIGFESGDPYILKRASRGKASPETNLFAAENLARNGIDVCASYVFGLPGETEESMEKTLENAMEVSRITKKYMGFKTREIDANLIEPHPGSSSFARLKRVFPETYQGKDVLDLEQIQRDYFRVFLGLKSDREIDHFRNLVIRNANRMKELCQYTDVMGYKASEIEQKK